MVESTETEKPDEQPEISDEESEKPSVITDEERAKIEEAVAKQSAAMRQLSQSAVLKVRFLLDFEINKLFRACYQVHDWIKISLEI